MKSPNQLPQSLFLLAVMLFLKKKTSNCPAFSVLVSMIKFSPLPPTRQEPRLDKATTAALIYFLHNTYKHAWSNRHLHFYLYVDEPRVILRATCTSYILFVLCCVSWRETKKKIKTRKIKRKYLATFDGLFSRSPGASEHIRRRRRRQRDRGGGGGKRERGKEGKREGSNKASTSWTCAEGSERTTGQDKLTPLRRAILMTCICRRALSWAFAKWLLAGALFSFSFSFSFFVFPFFFFCGFFS